MRDTATNRQSFLAAAAVVVALSLALSQARGEKKDVFLALEEAPKVLFPDADSFERKDMQVDDSLRLRMKKLIGRLQPSIWEPFYISFIARKQDTVIGYAVVCEEIGKHRPITFIVGVTPDGAIQDVAVMMYREAIGGEVRYQNFLKQFDDKNLDDPILPRRDIKNITGATLSVRAMARGVRKVLAFVQLTYLQSDAGGGSAQ